MKKPLLFCLLLLLGNSVGPILAQEPQPDANQLMEEVVLLTEQNEKFKSEHLRSYRIFTILNLKNNKIENKSGKPEENWVGAGIPGKALPITITQILDGRYDYWFGEPAIQGNSARTYYLVNFRPKRRGPKANNYYEEGANKFEGYMHVNVQDKFVQKMEANTRDGFNILAFLGRVRRVHVALEQEIRPDLEGIVVIKSLTINVDYRKLLSEKSEKRTYEYSKHQYIP